MRGGKNTGLSSFASTMACSGVNSYVALAMAGAGPLNSEEVASRSGCAERYVREWLNSQAAAGYVLYRAAL
jgi:hypothetical protein